MKLNPRKLKSRAKKKAGESLCNYRVVAIALSKNGTYIGIKSNAPRPFLSSVKRNSYHAEERLIRSIKPEIIHKILIGRIGKGGRFLPIDPCKNCRKLADKYGIIIERIE